MIITCVILIYLATLLDIYCYLEYFSVIKSIHTWCEPIIYVRNIIIGRNNVIHSSNRLIQFVIPDKEHFLEETFKMSLIMLNLYRH